MSELLQLAQRAWDRTAFFKSHYSERPTRDQEVEPTSYVAYHQASRLEDCLIDAEQLLGAIPSFSRNHRRLPINVVESEQEWRYRHQRFIRALDDLGVSVDRPNLKVLIAADDSTGPFGCELSKFLSWNKCQAPISFNASSPEILRQDIRDIAPDVTLLLPPAFLSAPPRDMGSCIHVAHHSMLSMTHPDLPVVLVCDPLHVLGAKPSGQRQFLFDSESLLLERESASGFTWVTNLKHDFFPIIRYQVDVPFESFRARKGDVNV